MILQAVSDSTTPPDLTVSLTLDGVKMQGTITLERSAEDPSQLPSLPPPVSNTLPNQDNKAGQGSESHEEPPKDTDNSDINTNEKPRSSPKYQDSATDVNNGTSTPSATAVTQNPAAVHQASLSDTNTNSEPLPGTGTPTPTATTDTQNPAAAVPQASFSAPAADSEPLPKSQSASSLQSTEQHEGKCHNF